MRIFLDRPGEHLSAEEVYELLKLTSFHISKATVYRTVDLLTHLRFLRRVDFGEGVARYELSDQSPHSHHHLICTACSKVIPIDIDLLEDLEKRITRSFSFQIVDHQLKFYGLCEDCRERNPDKRDSNREV